MMAAYDNEQLLLLIFWIVLYAVLVTLTWFVAGGVLCRSVGRFVRWSTVRSKWIDVLEQMDQVEEAYLKGTVYEDDLKKVEHRLSSLAQEIHAMGTEER